MRPFSPPVLTLVFCLTCTLSGIAQNQSDPTPAPKSLADLAKEANKNKAARAKTVISNDNLQVTKGPLPEMNFEGVDNSDEITAAMQNYRQSHGTKETEDLIHAWYDKYYATFIEAIEENKALASRQEDRYYNRAESITPQDARQYRQLRNAEARSAHNDFNKAKQNGLMTARIQQTFMKVRTELVRSGLRYTWFKIPFANGNGSY
ncbi:MAG: hypothetical protein JWO13_1571 [Acidobacteriales bacterium]|nr:hypothetical protein [Terriglobales bacterium]